jgi:DNA repair exonuclease SbcCD ATPase subunit
VYQLESIELFGFGLFYHTQRVVFLEGLTFITGMNLDSPQNLMGSNGAAKTTILNGIGWALYGKCPAGALGELRNHFATVVEVTLKLKGADQDLVIKRRMKGKAHEVVLDIEARQNPEHVAGDVAMVQDRINKLVGCDYQLFDSMLYFRGVGDTTQFLHMTPAKRATVLSNIVDDTYFQIGAQILKGRVQELVSLQGNQSMELITLRQQLGTLEGDLSQAFSAKANWDSQEAQRIQLAGQSYNTAYAQLAQVSKDLIEAKQFLHENQFADLSRRHAEAGSAVQALEGDRRVLEADLARLPSRHYLEAHREACPTCGQVIEPLNVLQNEKRRLELQGAITAKANELAAHQRVYAELATTVQRVQQNALRIKALEDQAETLHQTAIHHRDACEPRRADYLEGQIAQLQQRLWDGQARVRELEGLLVETSLQIDLHKKVASAFGGEVRNLMFDLIRGPLEEWTHHYVNLLLDTGIHVQFPHQDTREKFVILVWNGQHSQELSLYSGGELWRITIAILLAFRKVLADQRVCKLDFLLMDDFAGELANEGVAQALVVLEQLTREEIGTILMTIPKAEFLPPGRYHNIHVTRKGGQAVVSQA